MVSVLVEEGAVEVGAFQEVVAAVSPHEEEVVRGVVSHGVVVDYPIPCVLQSHHVDILAFWGLRVRCSRNQKIGPTRVSICDFWIHGGLITALRDACIGSTSIF